jgi:hypothetical protein
MFALAQVTEQFLQSLPAEFTKKDFDSARKVFDGHPLSLQTCRDYGFVVVARTEPATYTKLESVWVDVKGRKYNEEEMEVFDRRAIATLFDRPDYTDRWGSIYCLPYHDEPVEHACERNIFRFNVEKFKRFLEENA